MYLNDSLESHLRLTPKQKTLLKKSGFQTVRDLLWHFPSRYESFHEQKSIADLESGDAITVTAEVIKSSTQKTWRRKMPLAETVVSDNTGKLRIVWFNQPYMANMLKKEVQYTFSGKVQRDKKGLYMANPDYGPPRSTIGLGDPEKNKLTPMYPTVNRISSRWFQYAIEKLLGQLKEIKDPIPDEILEKYKLPSLKTAIIEIHQPRTTKSAKASRKRFAFEEIFYYQL